MKKVELGDGEPSPPHVQTPADWIEVRRGFGSIDLFEDLRSGEFVTASGLNDGGFIVWRKLESGAAQEVSPPSPRQSPQDFITTHVSFPRATVFYLNEVIELMKGYAEQAEGDTRERCAQKLEERASVFAEVAHPEEKHKYAAVALRDEAERIRGKESVDE